MINLYVDSKSSCSKDVLSQVYISDDPTTSFLIITLVLSQGHQTTNVHWISKSPIYRQVAFQSSEIVTGFLRSERLVLINLVTL